MEKCLQIKHSSMGLWSSQTLCTQSYIPVLSAQLMTAPTGRAREIRNFPPAEPPRPETCQNKVNISKINCSTCVHIMLEILIEHNTFSHNGIVSQTQLTTLQISLRLCKMSNSFEWVKVKVDTESVYARCKQDNDKSCTSHLIWM